MSILKQRVAMATVQGDKAFITTEWLKDLNATITEAVATTTTTTPTTTTVSAADFAALVARVKKLEGGYQA